MVVNWIHKRSIKKEIRKETDHLDFLIRMENLYLQMDDIEKRNARIKEINTFICESMNRLDNMNKVLFYLGTDNFARSY